MLQTARSRVRNPMRQLNVINLCNPSGSTPRDMFQESSARPVREADNLTANCEPIV
jgi:hypothetical protein